MPRGSEYRYSLALAPGPCPEHPACIIRTCQRFFCSRPVHVALISRASTCYELVIEGESFRRRQKPGLPPPQEASRASRQ